MKLNSQSLKIPEGLTPSSLIVSKVEEFLNTFSTQEGMNGVPLLLHFDRRSGAFYLICHLDSKTLASRSDLEAVLDPVESEDYKLNRNLYVDTYGYKVMASDALKGRSFEDIVVEFDTSYRHEKALKVFGGQHRIKAITEAIKKDVSTTHGVRVYYCLTLEQKFDIAVANNTSIAVSNDLLDRMQENLLGTDLRTYCQSVGLLDKGQDFADRRSPEGVPTVRIARTLVVNYNLGKHAKKGSFHSPVVCSSGAAIDKNYKEVRVNINWSDSTLKKMGQEFARLHKLQRERVLNRDRDKHIEFANKGIHPCVTASWSFAAGLLERDPKALKAHYALSDFAKAAEDPLSAKDLSGARLQGVDPDTYRGLGARINSTELGRMLEVFLLQATKAKKRGISLKLANAAIKSYEAKRRAQEAAKALRRI
jgi:hypothetical protein